MQPDLEKSLESPLLTVVLDCLGITKSQLKLFNRISDLELDKGKVAAVFATRKFAYDSIHVLLHSNFEDIIDFRSYLQKHDLPIASVSYNRGIYTLTSDKVRCLFFVPKYNTSPS